ncbi:transmembrane protein 163a-like [Lethenteron reissneri]|uniref:transmembrane protein 163a-like n=1 Tax=Lethenteron reissneri TaxID=7753 RepID=UPI002AB7AFF6|nr:transmembrane protein 163a-like [Lethenteron reissneri]
MSSTDEPTITQRPGREKDCHTTSIPVESWGKEGGPSPADWLKTAVAGGGGGGAGSSKKGGDVDLHVSTTTITTTASGGGDGSWDEVDGEARRSDETSRELCDTEVSVMTMENAQTWDQKGLLESSKRLKPHEAQSLRKKALWVSWTSIAVTIILSIFAFTVSMLRYSPSSFGFAVDATLDVLSSVIVAWRYNNAAAVHSAYREYVACCVLGGVFMLSSMCIIGKSSHDIAHKLVPKVDAFLLSVSVLSGVLCLGLAGVKFILARALTSRALMTDAFNSLVGGIMGFSILFSDEVFKHNPSVWYMDGLIGILMGIIIMLYGVKLLVDMIPRMKQTQNYESMD